MSAIETFFLDTNRICEAVANKITTDMDKDIPARRALSRTTGDVALSPQGRADVLAWLQHYKVLMGIPSETRLLLTDTISNLVCNITLASGATHSVIVAAHDTVRNACLPVTQRDAVSLSSKVLWLLFPDVVPILDSQAWIALKVVSRLAGCDIPRSSSRYSNFLCAHRRTLQSFYEPVRRTIAENFDRVFDTASRSKRAFKEEARSLYANEFTVLDQLLWRLGD